MALSKIDVANMLTGATPVANGGTAATTFAGAGLSKRPNAKPLWYNGNMQVSQRGDSTGVTNGNSDYYACDRYKFNEDGTMSAVLTITQKTLTSGNAFTTDGHTRALKYDVTTADTSVANDIYARIEQRFEKQDLQVLKKGTSNAEKVTLAFWVKATVTGTNVVEFQDQANTRHCCATYTISSSDTWEHKVITFAADTSTGDPFGTGNGLAANINFVLQAGSNYTSGTLATAWADSVDANRAAGHNSNHFSSTSNNFHLTGIQLEVGEYTSSTLPPFQHESFEENVARCLRYFEKRCNVTEAIITPAQCVSATKAMAGLHCTEKRAVPSVTLGACILITATNGSAGSVTSTSIGAFSSTGGRFDANIDSSNLTAGNITYFQPNSTTDGVTFNAEL